MARQCLCGFVLALLVLSALETASGQSYEWAAGEAGFGSPVHSLAVYDAGGGEAVYAGGEFGIAGGHYGISNIARWNGADWFAVGSGLNNTPEALAVWGGELIAGGWFTSSGSVNLYHIGKWNGLTW
jgi:trimeric autotransporter adhesin